LNDPLCSMSSIRHISSACQPSPTTFNSTDETSTKDTMNEPELFICRLRDQRKSWSVIGKKYNERYGNRPSTMGLKKRYLAAKKMLGEEPYMPPGRKRNNPNSQNSAVSQDTNLMEQPICSLGKLSNRNNLDGGDRDALCSLKQKDAEISSLKALVAQLEEQISKNPYVDQNTNAEPQYLTATSNEGAVGSVHNTVMNSGRLFPFHKF
jgi:hypothetical protein